MFQVNLPDSVRPRFVTLFRSRSFARDVERCGLFAISKNTIGGRPWGRDERQMLTLRSEDVNAAFEPRPCGRVNVSLLVHRHPVDASRRAEIKEHLFLGQRARILDREAKQLFRP